ncbi:Type I restriction-modification system, specificity subunit S [uncultured Candidatus Thioglobus sp.]|nr:Type I restriction-modification system, specificity subunit S [uncultured Candidatus Thioglobus sp.]
MNENKPLPKGWEVKNLGDIGKIFNGNSINATIKKEKYLNINGGMPYIATKDISYENIIDYSNGISIPFEEKSNFRFVPKNTTLICAEGGSAGRKIGFTSQEVCFGNKLFALIVKNGISNKYIYYYYFSDNFQKDFQGQMTGIIGGVSMAKFKKLNIPLPSLPEQKCIVAILDKTFAEITKAEAIAKTNLQNAKELFESYLNNVFENKGDDWEEKRLEEVCDIRSKLVDPKESQYQDLIHIGAGNIVSEKGILVDLKTAKEENLISGKFLFDDSMVLYSKIRPYLMKIVKCGFKGLCSADIYPLVPFKNKMIQSFLYRLFYSNDFTAYAIRGSQRAGMPKVNRKHLFAYSFFLPPIREQQQIVKKLNALQSETKKLEIIYQHKIEDLEELKKSILQKAFNGML